jgi:ATP-dependent DNA helicase RecG
VNYSQQNIHAFLKAGESETLEFKSSFDRETIETLVALANTSGGIILVGVADKGSITGVTTGKETLNE